MLKILKSYILNQKKKRIMRNSMIQERPKKLRKKPNIISQILIQFTRNCNEMKEFLRNSLKSKEILEEEENGEKKGDRNWVENLKKNDCMCNH